MPSSKKKETKPKTELNRPQGTVVNNFGTVINKFFRTINDKFLKQIRTEQRIGFLSISFLIVGMSVLVYFGLRQKQKPVMTGEFRIAIATFDENGRGLPDNIGFQVADGIYLRLSDELQEITVGPKVEIWGPEIVGTIKGKTSEIRTENAEKLAERINAYMVIYGSVEDTSDGMIVNPEFFLDTQGFHEGSEVIGQYRLGSPFSLPGRNNPAWQFDFDRQMQTRSDIISSIAVGLSYLSVYEYESALESLEEVEAIDEWKDSQGKEILYTLIGFTAGKAGDYELTKSSHERAIDINPDYSRPYIGLANLYYILAVQPFEESKIVEDVDQSLLNKCFEYLNLAVGAPEKPPLAEVDTKIYFSRGQCYWLKTYTGQLPDFSLAINEFQNVLNAYNDGENPRVRELAAESYARLGLISNLLNDLTRAVDYYQKAADLLPDNPIRQGLYQKRANDLQQLISQPTP